MGFSLALAIPWAGFNMEVTPDELQVVPTMSSPPIAEPVILERIALPTDPVVVTGTAENIQQFVPPPPLKMNRLERRKMMALARRRK